MNPSIVLSPSRFTIATDDGKSSINVTSVVSRYYTYLGPNFFWSLINLPSIVHSKCFLGLSTGSFTSSRTSSSNLFPHSELDSLILSNSIYSFFFSLFFNIWSHNLLSYSILFIVELDPSLFDIFNHSNFHVYLIWVFIPPYTFFLHLSYLSIVPFLNTLFPQSLF